MKKLFYILTILACTLLSCNKDKDDIERPDDPKQPETPAEITLSLSTQDLVFEAKGGWKEFTINCSSAWTITGGNAWCQPGATSGSGKSQVKVIVETSTLTSDRNVNLTVRSGSQVKVLAVTQKGVNALTLTKDKFDLSAEGGDLTVTLQANVECTSTIPSAFQSWIKKAPGTKAMTSQSFRFTVSPNESTDKREGYIVFSGGSLKDTIRIYQSGQTPAEESQLILSKDTYDLSAEAQEIIVELKTNIDYEVTVPDSVGTWISYLSTRALRTDKLHFSIAENDSDALRMAVVIFKEQSGELTDTLHIFQEQGNVIIIGQKKYRIRQGGQDIAIEIKSNVDYTVTVSQQAQSWIWEIPATRGLTTTTLNYRIAAHSGLTDRTGQIIVRDKNSSLADTVQITQERCNTYIGDIVLETEQDVIDFSKYTKIIGNVSVVGNELETLQQLNNNLTEIDGSLTITCSNLTTFDGLNNLSSISGDFISGDYSSDFLNSLTSFEGLNNLSSIGGNFSINSGSRSLNSLTSFEGLNNLTSIGGDFSIGSSGFSSDFLNSLTSFEGLNNLTSIGGDFSISASAFGDYTKSLYSLASFEGLNNLTSIGGDFNISASADGDYAKSLYSLTSFAGLNNLTSIGGNFSIRSASVSPSTSAKSSRPLYSLASFEGLNNLTSIGGDFSIYASASGKSSEPLYSLASFKGLNNLTSIGGDFSISAFAYGDYSKPLYSLASFEGLNNLTSIGGSFSISATAYDDYSKPLYSLASFKGLNNLTTIGGFSIRVFVIGESSLYSLASFEGLNNLTSIGGDFSITNGYKCLSSLTSFSGLNNLTSIGGNFSISYLSSLTSLEGLNNLSSIGGNFSIRSLSSLTSLEGLNNLSSIGGNFRISGLGSLTSLEGLNNLTSIGGNFNISTLISLTSLEGLNNLTSIRGDFNISYHLSSLTSFSGLNNLSSIGGNFSISSLSSLTSLGGLNNLTSIKGDLAILNCENLRNFCALRTALQNMTGTYDVSGNYYNPTKNQILNGQCSK